MKDAFLHLNPEPIAALCKGEPCSLLPLPWQQAAFLPREGWPTGFVPEAERAGQAPGRGLGPCASTCVSAGLRFRGLLLREPAAPLLPLLHEEEEEACLYERN